MSKLNAMQRKELMLLLGKLKDYSRNREVQSHCRELILLIAEEKD